MRQKKMWRYFCEFCRKSFGKSDAAMRHEAHCIKNPDRHCMMCVRLGYTQKPMNELVTMLPKIEFKDACRNYITRDSLDKLEQAVNEMKDAEMCPACILAALYQANAHVWAFGFFNYIEYHEKMFNP